MNTYRFVLFLKSQIALGFHVGQNINVLAPDVATAQAMIYQQYGADVQNIEGPTGVTSSLVAISDPLQPLFANFTITPAQFKTLDGNVGTNIQLIPAPGAGLTVIILRAFTEMQYGTAQYFTGTKDLELFYNLAGSNKLIQDVMANNVLTATATRVTIAYPTASDTPAAPGPGQCANCPVVLNLASGGSAYTNGDSSFLLGLEYSIYAL